MAQGFTDAGLLAKLKASTRSPAIEPASKLNIIIAEDCRISQLVARGFAENLNHTVEIVNNGQELIEALTWESYDVILLDCQMPEMDGYEAARVINEMLVGKKRPRLIAVTANTTDADIQKCLDAGMDLVIAKPLEQEALAKALAREPVGIELRKPEAEVQASEQANPSFDQKSYLENLHGVQGLALKTITQFLDALPGMMATIFEAVEKHDEVNLELSAHRLKGAVANFRAEPSRQLAFKIEQIGKNNFKTSPVPLFNELRVEMDRLAAALAKLRDKL